MFEPFKVASRNAQILHVVLFLFALMSWISTIVTFNNSLMEFSDNVQVFGVQFSLHTKVYWNHAYIYSDNANHQPDSSISSVLGGGCKAGAEAALAFAVFAFLLLLALCNILAARIGGWSFPGVRDTHHSITLEMLLAMGAWFCFFIQVCSFGGACFTQARNTSNYYDVKATGFAYMLSCFFFLLVVIVGYVRMRQNSDLALGNGASKAGSSQSSYSEPESHGSDEAGSYSYQGSAAL